MPSTRCAIHANPEFKFRRLGFFVFAALLLIHAATLTAGLDFRDYDDLVRSVLARIWVREPYFMIGDGYWPTLPAILRGGFLGLCAPLALPHPELALFLIRLVTVAMLWGCWRLLAALTRLLGGGPLAVALLTACFLFNGGTIHFAASAYSEPDAFFYFLAALYLTLRLIRNPPSSINPQSAIESDGGRGRPRSRQSVFALGLALAAGCLTRYEAWSFPIAFAAAAAWASRRSPGPRWGWVWLLLPAAAIGVWLAFQSRRFGDPFHFIQIGRGYNHLPESLRQGPATLALTARKFLALHPLWIPPALVLGGAELIRRRREPVFFAFALFTLLLFCWAFFRLWSQQMTLRFVWDAALLLTPPAALAAERSLARRPRQARPLAAGFILASGAVFLWLFARLHPYAPPAVRAFARAVQRQSAGPILLCDHLDFAQAPDLQLFRLSVRTERLVQSDWLAQPPTPATLRSRGIRYVLARRARPELAAGPPLLAAGGWALWPVNGP